MKTQLNLLVFCLALTIHPVLSQNGRGDVLVFSEEVKMNGATKDVLYESAKGIFLEKYQNSPYLLRMNKNTSCISGGSVETMQSNAKSITPTLTYHVFLKLKDDGYVLEVKDFYYKKSSKHGKGVKVYLKGENTYFSSKKAKNTHRKLSVEANLIAQQVHDDFKKNIVLNLEKNEIENTISATESTSW